jgi:GNAT superfamily N-acetyltransferase
MTESDLDAATAVGRLAFGTFLGVPDPRTFGGDSEAIRTRWRTRPDAAFVAELDGELVGAAMAARWGEVAFFGPLVVHPKLWDHGIGQRLLEPIMKVFCDWGSPLTGLFTFSNSPKHLVLYQKFGFRARTLTALCTKAIATEASSSVGALSLGTLPAEDRSAWIHGCQKLTESIHEGLDATSELESVIQQTLGEVVLLGEGPQAIDGFAVTHIGPGTEAGSGVGYVKFAAVRGGTGARISFERLMRATASIAGARGAHQLLAGVNTAREEAYATLLGLGFRIETLGLIMHRPNEPGYDRPECWILDDWR